MYLRGNTNWDTQHDGKEKVRDASRKGNILDRRRFPEKRIVSEVEDWDYAD